MAAGRHNLSRRALLGAGAAAWVGTVYPDCPPPPSGDSRSPTVPAFFPGGQSASDCPHSSAWSRTLAAYRRAETRVAAFKAEEARLPAKRRAFPCEDLEQEFGRLDSLRLAALRRLLRLPAPDLAAHALKLDLAVADQAWELEGCETCLAALAADARGLAGVGPENSSA